MELTMEEFITFMAEILETDAAALTMETSQQDVETWDSLMQLRLMGEIEAKYGIMIPMDDVATLTTIGAFYNLVK
jgi:acyl carrier protein